MEQFLSMFKFLRSLKYVDIPYHSTCVIKKITITSFWKLYLYLLYVVYAPPFYSDER